MEPESNETKAAYQVVERFKDRADYLIDEATPAWHGWALREAFMEGIEYQKRQVFVVSRNPSYNLLNSIYVALCGYLDLAKRLSELSCEIVPGQIRDQMRDYAVIVTKNLHDMYELLSASLSLDHCPHWCMSVVHPTKIKVHTCNHPACDLWLKKREAQHVYKPGDPTTGSDASGVSNLSVEHGHDSEGSPPPC